MPAYEHCYLFLLKKKKQEYFRFKQEYTSTYLMNIYIIQSLPEYLYKVCQCVLYITTDCEDKENSSSPLFVNLLLCLFLNRRLRQTLYSSNPTAHLHWGFT